jgi:hypothetical protein
VDVLSDEISGYKREVITLGNVSDKTTITVTLRNLNNPRLWEEVKDATVIEEVKIVRKTVKKIVFLDGSEKIIDEESLEEKQTTVDDDPKSVLKEYFDKKKDNKKKPKKSQKKVVIVKPNVTVISGEEIKLAAQHKEARDGQTNAITTAMANSKDSLDKKKKTVKSEDREKTDSLVYDSKFYWRLMNLTYQDLDILGSVLAKCIPIFENIFVKPKFRSRDVHQQELDKFRDGHVTLREIRAMGNRLKASTPDQIGTPVSPQQIIKRMIRSFYHWGSAKEKESLRLNQKLSELPYGKQNQKKIQDKINEANKKSKKFKKDLKET